MRKTIILPSVIAAVAMMVAACSSVDCPVENIVATVYKLQRVDGTPDTLRTDTLTITSPLGNAGDTTLLNRSIATTSFQLPVSYLHPVDTLYLTLADTSQTNHKVYHDTIYISKTNSPHFESVDCNISYFHEITAVEHTHNRIDSIVINKSSVNYDLTKEHLRLYFNKP